MDRDIQTAVEYILAQAADKDIHSDALRKIIEGRIRMVCADALRWQARALQTAAENL